MTTLRHFNIDRFLKLERKASPWASLTARANQGLSWYVVLLLQEVLKQKYMCSVYIK